MIVVLGELGGKDEYSLVDALKQGKVSKPVVAWVSGTCARLFKSEVQFGHAVSSFLTLCFLFSIYENKRSYRGITFLICPGTEPLGAWLQGAKSGGDEESAQTKNKSLADAGAIVPTSFEGLEATIKATYDSLVIIWNSD